MSLADYESALPGLFPSHDANGKEQDDLPTPAEKRSSGRSKDFADIVEYHINGLAGRDVEIIPFSKFVPKKSTGHKRKVETYEDYAIVLRRTWVLQDRTSYPVREELEIQSQALCVALREIILNSYEDTDLTTFPIKIPSPFSELFFYRDEIRDLCEDRKRDPGLRREAKMLDDFIRNRSVLSGIIRDYEKYLKHGQAVGEILWTIYSPNSLLMLNSGLIRECWICRNVKFHYSRVGSSNWEVTGLRVGFDGSTPGLIKQTISIPLVGMQLSKISDLALVPVQRCTDWITMRSSLLVRSMTLRKVLGEDLSSFRAQAYSGPVWNDHQNQYSALHNSSMGDSQIDERVMVDYTVAPNRHRYGTLEKLHDKPRQVQTNIPKGVFLRESDDEPSGVNLLRNPDSTNVDLLLLNEESEESTIESRKENLRSLSKAVSEVFHIKEENFQLLFPALVPAFCLQSKKWWWVLSDQLKDVQWNKSAFDFLHLKDITKDLIKSLVEGHKKGSIKFDDVITGKGQGLIFLLHGEPGLGKTLTAESVADHLERPLYSISGGELSTDVTRLELKLNEIFLLTKRWNAVSLLDEADVLLCKRNSAEMDRNAIVAVFLRKMEYFQGVLFLTTNRKDDFDDAFKSRIHVTISYPGLSEEAQSAIWRKLIENNQVQIGPSWDKVFLVLGRLNLNGRTIKNLLRTAVAYAHADEVNGGTLTPHHILAIIETELAESNADTVDLSETQRKKRTDVGKALDELRDLTKAK